MFLPEYLITPKVLRFVQPLGFACLMVYFIFTGYTLAIWLFWAGIVLSTLGTLLEVIHYIKTPKKKRSQRNSIFTMGIVVKLLLIASITARIYDLPYSVYILLGSIVISFIWFVLSQTIKPNKTDNTEFLDVE